MNEDREDKRSGWLESELTMLKSGDVAVTLRSD